MIAAKRTCLCLTLTLACATGLAAQETPKTPARESPGERGSFRIAVVNIGTVFTNYTKATSARKDMQAVVEPYKAALEKLRDEAVQFQKKANDSTADADARAAANKKLAEVRRRMQELEQEVRKVIGKASEEQLVTLYGDIEAAVRRYAEAHDIDLVLTFGDPAADQRMKFPNINRKMQAMDQGGVIPLYIRPRIDITQAVLKLLNDAPAPKK